jgi:L-lactate dehydrogenase (cytochrome)
MAWLRQNWSGRLVIKGVLHPQDAQRATALGADALIVSNHGGRQLDGAVAPLHALPAIAQAVGSDMPLFLDGGIRRGTDVLKALALGARFVFVGRPTLCGLAVGGAHGVRSVLALLQQEIERDLALLGCSEPGAVDAGLLRPHPWAGRLQANG